MSKAIADAAKQTAESVDAASALEEFNTLWDLGLKKRVSTQFPEGFDRTTVYEFCFIAFRTGRKCGVARAKIFASN